MCSSATISPPRRLQQVDENRRLVTNEIKKSICSLIMEINRKGKILVNQLEVLSLLLPCSTLSPYPTEQHVITFFKSEWGGEKN